MNNLKKNILIFELLYKRSSKKYKRFLWKMVYKNHMNLIRKTLIQEIKEVMTEMLESIRVLL